MNLNTTCVVTIVSANYLAYAQVLRRSVARHIPEAAFCVLVVDRPTSQVRAAVAETGLEVVYATELPLPDIEQIAYKYDILELNTGLKPTFIKLMIKRGFEKIVYFDPDIQVFEHPSVVLDALDDDAIVLTPHALAPVMDGLRPSDIDFLRGGVFNLGFVAVRSNPAGHAFLDWWEARCLSYGFSDTGFGTFVDQKWINLVPTFFPSHHVLRDPGCNVAYWNLHERTVSDSGEAYLCNGRPLVFFHFSGVNASRPDVLSKHQNRHVPVPGSSLHRLVGQYCRQLTEAGHSKFVTLPYTFGKLSDGTAITPTMRRAYTVCTPLEANPFDATGPLQSRLRRAGMSGAAPKAARPTLNTLNYNSSDKRIVLVNRAVRAITRVIGVDRCRLLIDYAAHLGRESNFASAICDAPPDFRHTDKRQPAAGTRQQGG